jgi:hypothetical protein
MQAHDPVAAGTWMPVSQRPVSLTDSLRRSRADFSTAGDQID